MKRIVAILIFCFLFYGIAIARQTGEPPASQAQANVSLKGKVLDKETGETLAGVEILIPGTNLRTTTDLDGNFEINNLPTGNITLELKYISYKIEKLDCMVQSGQSNVLNISMRTIEQ